MQGRSVDELLDVTVERVVLEQLQVEVGGAVEDRIGAGLPGDDRRVDGTGLARREPIATMNLGNSDCRGAGALGYSHAMRELPGRDRRTALAEAPKWNTRDDAKEAQRRRIMRATGELIAKRGYAGVTVELIVKRARVSFKTFYNHYANIEEAFADLYDRAVAATRAQLEAALADSDAPWPEQAALAVRGFFEAILAEPLIARALLVEGPTAGPKILGRYEMVSKAFVPVLARGREWSPEARDLPATLEDTLAGAVLWSAYQRLNFSEVDRIPALIPENIELVLRPYVGATEASRIARESAASVPAAG